MSRLDHLRWWLRTPPAKPERPDGPPDPAAPPLHVACAADAAYAPHCAAMLHSVLTHSGGLPVHVHFLHDPALPAAALARLRALTTRHGATLDPIAVPPDLVDDLHVTGAIARPAWYRVLLPRLRPALDRVLYLDCDTIVVGSLRPLWETPLDGHLAAAVRNVIETGLATRHHALGIPPQQPYFNSGVLLMDLAQMRRERCDEQILEHARAHGAKLIWVDQDSLNRVLGPRCRLLHPRWNCQTSIFYWREAEAVFGAAAVAEALADPAIIHFEGPDLSKPWNYLCKHPYRTRYLDHRQAAGWEPPRFEGRNWRRGLIRLLPMRLVPHALLLARAWRDRWRACAWRTGLAQAQARLRHRVGGTAAGRLARAVRDRVRATFEPQALRYDRETIEVMRRVLRPDSCCVDVGAHEGAILAHIARLAPAGTHFAFEPLPHLARQLAARFPGVRVVETALGERGGTADFVHVENDPAYSGLRPRVYDRPDPILRRIGVTLTRLDDALPADLPVRLIKLDIEGGEFHALRGAAATLQRCRPFVVFEAGAKSTGQYGVGPDDIYRFLVEVHGYRLSTMRRWLRGRPPYSPAEYRAAWQDGTDYYFIAYPG